MQHALRGLAGMQVPKVDETQLVSSQALSLRCTSCTVRGLFLFVAGYKASLMALFGSFRSQVPTWCSRAVLRRSLVLSPVLCWPPATATREEKGDRGCERSSTSKPIKSLSRPVEQQAEHSL